MARLGLLLALSLAIVCLVVADPCSTRSSCGTCAGARVSSLTCRWCQGSSECVSERTSCSRPGFTITRAQQCNPVPVQAPTAVSTCHLHSNCGSCIAAVDCGWCASRSICRSISPNHLGGEYCSSFYLTSCPRTHNLTGLWIMIGGGVLAIVFVGALLCFLRRRRQLATNDAIELVSTDTTFDAPSAYAPQAATALPGYMYTTTSSSPNQPSYIYTAVPVGPVLASVPNQ